jgi:hypothetical protein
LISFRSFPPTYRPRVSLWWGCTRFIFKPWWSLDDFFLDVPIAPCAELDERTGHNQSTSM